MKKVLLFASAFVAMSAAFAQTHADVVKITTIPADLNDSVIKYYSTDGSKLTSVKGLELADTSLFRIKGYWSDKAGLYTYKPTAAGPSIELDRTKNGADNYADFNIVWAGWGLKFEGTPDQAPFATVIGGTLAAPTKTAAAALDTLTGYSVDLYDAPVVTIKVQSTDTTNIRIDLIDKNRRVANVLAPHHWIKGENKDTTLTFRWDKVVKVGGEINWKYEDPDTDDFDVAVAVDGWAGAWWNVDAGRNTATKPLLGGKTAWDGGILLDLHNIVGLGFTIEDGAITADHKLSVDGTKKTVTFKSIVIGEAAGAKKLDKATVNPANKVDVVETIEAAQIIVGSNVGRTFNVVADAELVTVLGTVVAKSVDGVITTDAPKGVYYVVTKLGTAKVIVE